jgi:hypothetical protein
MLKTKVAGILSGALVTGIIITLLFAYFRDWSPDIAGYYSYIVIFFISVFGGIITNYITKTEEKYVIIKEGIIAGIIAYIIFFFIFWIGIYPSYEPLYGGDATRAVLMFGGAGIFMIFLFMIPIIIFIIFGEFIISIIRNTLKHHLH